MVNQLFITVLLMRFCDDSDGCVGDVFRYDAKELFVAFALRCTDKEKIAATLLKLNRKDEDCLVEEV